MATTTRMTLEEFLHRPDDDEPAMEYACGEMFQKPMPTLFHSILQRYFIVVLAAFLEQTKLGQVLPEFRVIFGPARSTTRVRARRVVRVQ